MAIAPQFAELLSQALVSSVLGLTIAVMAILSYHFLYGRVRSLVHDFEWVGHEVYQFLHSLASEAKES